MTLIDPRDALAEQSNFIHYLMGLAGLGQVVQSLAPAGDCQTPALREADDFVHMLLGIASLGESVRRLVEAPLPQQHSDIGSDVTDSATMRWLR